MRRRTPRPKVPRASKKEESTRPRESALYLSLSLSLDLLNISTHRDTTATPRAAHRQRPPCPTPRQASGRLGGGQRALCARDAAVAARRLADPGNFCKDSAALTCAPVKNDEGLPAQCIELRPTRPTSPTFGRVPAEFGPKWAELTRHPATLSRVCTTLFEFAQTLANIGPTSAELACSWPNPGLTSAKSLGRL